MSRPLRTRWVVSGVIEAPTEKVWEVLLDVIPNLSTVDKNTVALEDGPVHFTTPK